MYVIIILEDGRMAGPQSYVLELMNALNNECDVSVILPIQDNQEFCDRLRVAALQYHEISLIRPHRSIIGLIKYIGFYAFDVFKLLKIIKSKPNCIVYAAGGSWQTKGIIAAKIAKVPCVWQLNDTSVPIFIRILFWAMCNLPDGYVYVSDATKRYYSNIRKPYKPHTVIPSPINMKKYMKANIESVKEKHSRRKEVIKIGTVCSVNPVKNLEYFIQIAAEVNKAANWADFEFYIIGPVPATQLAYYKKLVAVAELYNQKVTFLGQKRYIPKVLNELDIYLCTSHNEASPIAVWEAMAAGLKIISTDVGDVGVHLKHSEAGALIPFDNAKKSAEILLDFCFYQKKFKNSKSLGCEYILNNFDADSNAAKHLRFFNEIR